MGNEHTTNPPIIISPISDRPIIEGSFDRDSTVDPVTPSPRSRGVSCEEDGLDTDSTTPHNSGKKVKLRNDSSKNREVVDLMKQNLEMKEKQQELLERADEREEKLVGLMEALVTHIVKKDLKE